MPRCIIPLYFYPLTPSTWEPLYAVILVNPLVEFVVIINPDSGPGSPSPDASYLAELQKLCNFRNVLTLGYVRTDYCRRPLVDVCGEISTYASWEEVGVPVSGIFFDETPNEYTPKAHAYLRAVSAMVKTVPGIQVPELVVHNPGCATAAGLNDGSADVTVAFEQSFNHYSELSAHELDRLNKRDRSNTCYIVHSVPCEEIPSLVRDISEQADYVFVTDLTEQHYNSFSPAWTAFIEGLTTVILEESVSNSDNFSGGDDHGTVSYEARQLSPATPPGTDNIH